MSDISNNSFVHTGLWTNWSNIHYHIFDLRTTLIVTAGRGAVQGATLTIPSSYARLLIAFLALYVRWSGGHLWDILCYIIHHIRFTLVEQDGLYHQQQVLLRTGLGSFTLFWQLLEVGWAWKSNTARAVQRSMPLALVALAHFALFAAAGILSSRIALTTDEAVMKSSQCGWADITVGSRLRRPVSNIELLKEEAVATNCIRTIYQAIKISRYCYAEAGSSQGAYSANCRTLALPRLERQLERDAPCPFKPHVCTRNAIALDSGLVDSHSHLGINTPEKDRLQVRRKLICAPISAENYSTAWTYAGSNMLDGDAIKSYLFGRHVPWFGDDYFGYRRSDVDGATFAVTNYSQQFGPCFQSRTFAAFAGNATESDFTPIPDFVRGDADVYIWTMRINVLYTLPVADPFFNVTALHRLGAPDAPYLWSASQPLTALACIDQYQLCGSGRCTDLGGLYQTIYGNAIQRLDLNINQIAIAKAMTDFLFSAQFRWLNFLNDDFLLAKDYVFSIESTHMSKRLPSYQWQDEVENLYNITLAQLQLGPLNRATPERLFADNLRDPTNTTVWVEPDTLEGKRLCKILKVRSVTHTSFSFVGLASILIGGAMTGLLKYALPIVVPKIPQRSSQGSSREMEWSQHGVLQLLRATAEAQEVGPWKGKEQAVPLTIEFGKRFHINLMAPVKRNEHCPKGSAKV